MLRLAPLEKQLNAGFKWGCHERPSASCGSLAKRRGCWVVRRTLTYTPTPTPTPTPAPPPFPESGHTLLTFHSRSERKLHCEKLCI